MNWKIIIVTAVVCVVAFFGCKKKRLQAAGAGDSVVAIEGAKGSDFPTADELYKAVNKYMAANQGRAAKNLDELIAKGYLKPVPPPLAGKRYELDQREMTLRLVDK